MLAPPSAEFSTARRLKPARQPDYTAASQKRFGGAAEGSSLGAPPSLGNIKYNTIQYNEKFALKN